MKKLFFVLLCVVTCLACSLTAFAGGPMTAEDALAAKSKGDIAEPYWLSRELNYGTVYKIRSYSNPDYYLNVNGGIDSDSTTINLWEDDSSVEQTFRLISSGSQSKLAAMCSDNGRVFNVTNPNTDDCKVNIWLNDGEHSGEQELVITGTKAFGFVIFLGSDQEYVLAADDFKNGGKLKFIPFTGDSNQMWDFIPQGGIASLPIQPDANAQNKTLWCWAAAAKMVAVHNGGGLNSSISTEPVLLDNKTEVNKNFYGLDKFGNLTVDGVQHAIVKHFKGTDGNVSGNNDDSIAALQYVSKNNMNVGKYGEFTKALSDTEINKINKDLLEGKYVIGSMTSRESAAKGDPDTAYGHSVVIQKYYPGTNGQEDRYVIFDPLTGITQPYSKSKIFGDDFGYYSEGYWCRISWYKWCH